MTEKKRPTAKHILDGVIQAMYDAQEPLDEDLVLVPAVYEVYLHPEAYRELQPLLSRISVQVRGRLDDELRRLNSRRAGSVSGFFRRLFFPFTRLLFADRYFRRPDLRRAAYERASDAWHLDFGVTAEPEADLDYLAVETDFGAHAQPAYKGRPTVNIRRRTTLLPNGRYETVLSAQRPGKTHRTLESRPPQVPYADVFARLSYEDRQGRHVYYMKKDQIVIGRQDEAARHLDVALDTLPDVSREHLRLRRDPISGAFSVKDLSQFGATVDGARIASSLNEDNEDVDRWHPLAHRAEIGLAGVVFLHFEAL